MHRSPAQQVNVKVIDCLPPIVAGIDDRSKAARQALTLSNACCNQMEVPQQFLIFGLRFRKRGNVLTRHDQYVGGRLGIDVPERVRSIILKDLLGRDLAGHDFAE